MFHAGVGSILTCAHNRTQWIRPQGIDKQSESEPGDYALLDIVGINTRYEMYLVWAKKRYQTKCARVFRDYVFNYYHV